ncbi:flagellar basal body rod C-terminal domain-containing protein [Tepidibacillus marianensis]|uniref:flagellar basal body rod C-terminal domain-containing protein n=1 Tax=Tepidibacillus marianensis TaxID=3131995 RepID=UPI0030D60F60
MNENYKIFQGKIERSNVDATQTMTDMMTALRIYEANQQVVQFLDKSLDKAVNEVGRV